MNGKLISRVFELVNVLGNGERIVGFWTLADGITKEMNPSISEKYPRSSSTNIGLETIIWPGGSTTTPKGWLMQMKCRKLRIGIPVNQGFEELIKVQRDPQTNATTAIGFSIDVFNAAIDGLLNTESYEFIPFEDSNGESARNYNDLVYQVYLQNYDAVVGDTAITANRSLYVDFTMPYTDLAVGTIARVDNKNMWIFLKPLDSNLWLTSAAFFILTDFVVWVIEHPINEEFQGSASQQIGTVFWFSFSTLVFAHREKLLSNLSRFTVIVWVFVVLILTSSYTVTLSSMLTVQQILLTSKENYIGYQSGSLIKGDIVSNLNFEDTNLMQYSSPKEYADALSRGTKYGGVLAIIDEIPYVKIFLARYSQDYAMIASESKTNGFGFVFLKGSPLVPEISRAIMKLRIEGKLMMMEKAWFNSESSFMSQQDSLSSPSNNPNALNLDNFSGLFLINGIGSALALVIFLINLLCEKWNVIKYYFVGIVGGKLVHTVSNATLDITIGLKHILISQMLGPTLVNE
ncbi:glutamate receptor 1.2-like [Cornus florida]|uniref:glutamate receptor 1.2-like n=1 Tax=Cornus florida TaxID=4283 RepID=UPI00289860BF|nr:glutamate receptor 1.2-like [Cornus florida]